MSLPGTSTSEKRMGWPAVLVISVVFIVAMAGFAFYWVGRLSPPEPFGADHMWQPWGVLVENEGTIGLASTIAVVLVGVALLASWRYERIAPRVLVRVLVLGAFAAWLGAGHRVTTAGVTGANIGGGLMVLMTPALAAGTVAVLWGTRRVAQNP